MEKDKQIQNIEKQQIQLLKNCITIAKLKPTKSVRNQLKRLGKIFSNVMEARNLALEKRKLLAMKEVGVLKSNNNREEVILLDNGEIILPINSKIQLPEL